MSRSTGRPLCKITVTCDIQSRPEPVWSGCKACGLVHGRYWFDSTPRLSFLFKKELWFTDSHCLVICPLTVNKTLNWLSSLPIVMQKSFWWWQRSVRYSCFPPTHLPYPHLQGSRLPQVPHLETSDPAGTSSGDLGPRRYLIWRSRTPPVPPLEILAPAGTSYGDLGPRRYLIWRSRTLPIPHLEISGPAGTTSGDVHLSERSNEQTVSVPVTIYFSF